MPSFFGYEFNWPTFQSPWTSSTGSRNGERANLVALGLGELFEPYTTIPAKFSQCIISGFTMFRSDVHNSERILHLIQALIAGAELGVAITLLFQSEECADLTVDICKAALMLKLLYTGTLAAGEVVSEISKDPYEPPMPAV